MDGRGKGRCCDRDDLHIKIAEKTCKRRSVNYKIKVAATLLKIIITDLLV